MRPTWIIRISAWLCLAVTGSVRSQELTFAELIKHVPEDANAIVVLNAEKIFESDVAVKEGWKQNYEKTFAAAPLILPPSARRFVMAAEFDLEIMKPDWQVALMELSKDPTVEEIANRFHGQVDSIGGFDAVLIPSDAYVIKFAPFKFGIVTPAERQDTAQWIRKGKRPNALGPSAYLQKAASYSDEVGTEIIMALDLADAVRIRDIRDAMERSPVVKEKKVDVDQVSQLLASIKGVTLGARVTNRVFGALKVDFDRDASMLEGVAKPLILEILSEAGATVEEFQGWKERLRGNSISIEGELTTDGMRRIFSILDLNTALVSGSDSASDNKKESSAEETMAYTSKQYFEAVNKYLRDLKGRGGAVSYGQIGLWIRNYANKIDRLPILNVDPELVDYGANVATQMRNATGQIQGMGISSSAREAQVQPERSWNYGGSGGVYGRGWGGYRLYGGGSYYSQGDVTTVQGDRAKIRAEERGKMAMATRGIFQDIENETAQIRRKMTQKYQIEF